MPELPEIETIRRDLQQQVEGHAVLSLHIKDPRLLLKQKESVFQKAIVGQVWKDIRRWGKYLQIQFPNGFQIIFHLRMTGQLVLHPQGEARDSYRALMGFDHGIDLAFYDQRRFGEILVVSPGEKWASFDRLGPDPTNGLTKNDFVKLIRSKTTRIQPLLMDQHVLAGVGNIYAQEALFKAGIRPTRHSSRLKISEAEKLYDTLRETLMTAIEHRGSSSRNYRDAFGQQGNAQILHRVYRKGGKPCVQCHGPLKASRVGGRGTVFCPQCQK